MDKEEIKEGQEEELVKLKKFLLDTPYSKISITVLRILWGRFSEIQEAVFLICDKESVERFKEWVESGDDNDAWS